MSAVALIKRYCSGKANAAERDMHGRVVMITGGTSGVGAAAALQLAKRGAQVILLTQLPPADPFIVEYVEDIRARTDNQFIYAEQVDLSSLYSIRQFATRWIDNAPPRRLDMIVLCAATLTPPGGKRTEIDGIESTWMVNYLANFHLLGILSPAIRAQPFDRDVRIIFTTCSAYIKSPLLAEPEAALRKEGWSPETSYARSKLALMIFGRAFQKHLDAYRRPDGLPTNARVVFVDPGPSRTPGMRRWLTRGSLWGLFLYALFYLLAWLFLKSPQMGAQSILFAAMDGSLGRGSGGKFIKECGEVDFARKDVKDDEVARQLWESTDRLIEKVEKYQAIRRARMKKEQEKRDREANEAEQIQEIESLVSTIKRGRELEGQRGKTRRKAKERK
jgi:NAD(P)-dependent dehydrogenase (short-subunit alcohol dehydrogenase family)